MKPFRLFSFVLVCTALAAHAQQNVSGRWQGSFDIPAPDGTTQHDTAFFVLQQNGTQITGSAGRDEEMQIALHDGLVRNNTVTFALDTRGTSVRFNLVFDGDHLRGTATGLPPNPTAKIAVDVARLPNLTVNGLLEHFSGSFLIARDGRVLADRSVGFANLAWHIGNSSATRFHIGSITKQFTAACILLLAEEGKLHLDDPITKYVDNSPDSWKGITLLQLLTHTSGIVSITDLPPEQERVTEGGTPTQIIERFRNQPLLFPPGTEARYSSSGYILLGVVIEKVSGQPYATFLQKNVFDPLGMRDTGVDDGIDVVENLASGYRTQAGALVRAEFIDMRIPFAAGDMYSTTHDLARWEDALYGGKLLRPESLKRMTTAGMGDFGLGVIVKKDQGERVISHTGIIQGFVSDLRYYPDSHTAIVVLSNSESKETLALSQLLADEARSGTLSAGTPLSASR